MDLGTCFLEWDVKQIPYLGPGDNGMFSEWFEDSPGARTMADIYPSPASILSLPACDRCKPWLGPSQTLG